MLTMVLIGGVALIVGATTLVRPQLLRGILKLEDSEAAAYGLRIGAVMLAVFGLLLIALPIAYLQSEPLDLNQSMPR